MLLAGGTRYLLLSSLLYVPGSLMYWAWQRGRGARLQRGERFTLALLTVMALIGLAALASGHLRL